MSSSEHLIHRIVHAIKHKQMFDTSNNYQVRVRILTLSPFTIAWTMQEFGASNYMAKKAREIKKKSYCIFGECSKG